MSGAPPTGLTQVSSGGFCWVCREQARVWCWYFCYAKAYFSDPAKSEKQSDMAISRKNREGE